MDSDKLKEIYLDQKKVFSSKEGLISRDIDLSMLIKTSRVVVISGVRRCGKSSLLYLLMEQLGLKEEDYCYFNFDDERIINNIGLFDDIYNIHMQLYNKKPILFLDEVQNINGWEKFVNRMYESGAKIFVTGSNAGLLSSEISTSLTGRNKTIDLFPFSFAEFLRFRSVKYDKDRIDTETKNTLIREFEVYMKLGGFPLVVKEEDKEVLEAYFKDILYRDIIARYRISQVEELKQIALYFASNISKIFSYSTLQKISGIKSTSSINNYLSYLAQSYLYSYLRKFDFSLKKQVLNPRKVYAIDHGLANRLAFNFSENKGRILENIVYIHLIRTAYTVFYYSQKGECDFILQKANNIKGAIQVCYKLNTQNKDREIGGLLEAIEEFNLENGLMLVYQNELENTKFDKRIKVLEVWKWLLEQQTNK